MRDAFAEQGIQSEESESLGLRGGACVCLGYALLCVLWNGVVVDEAVVAAQIITGAVRYPAGHPHEIFYKQAYSLPHYLAALTWWMAPGWVFTSATRNILTVFLSAFVPFALTTVLTRQAVWGYLAAALTMLETVVPFAVVNYPVHAFPQFYSHGHIAVHLTILIFTLQLAGGVGLPAFLLALFPAIHPAVALVSCPWLALQAYVTSWRKRRARRRMVAGVLAGGLICAALGGVIWKQKLGEEAKAPYDASGDEAGIQRTFTVTADLHNQIPPLRSFALLVCPVALLSLLGLQVWDASSRRRAERDGVVLRWLLGFGLFLLVGVLSAWTYRRAVGPLPPLLFAIRPFRLASIPILLLVPVTVALAAEAIRQMSGAARLTGWVLMGGLTVMVGVFAASHRFGTVSFYLVALWGVTLGLDFYAWRGVERRRWGGLAVCGLLAVAMAGIPDVEKAIVLVGAFAGAVAVLAAGSRLAVGMEEVWTPRLAAGLLVCCGAAAVGAFATTTVVDRWHGIYDETGRSHGRWDRFEGDDPALVSWMVGHAGDQDLILSFPYPRAEWQAKSGRPVLAEIETAYLVTYLRRLAPPIAMLLRDGYGPNFSDAGQLARYASSRYLESPLIAEEWRGRSRQQWRELAGKYGLRYVVAPRTVPLDLTECVRGAYWVLWEVSPRDRAEGKE